MLGCIVSALHSAPALTGESHDIYASKYTEVLFYISICIDILTVHCEELGRMTSSIEP